MFTMKIKVLLLADANSPHTQKWARSLADNGVNVIIFSLGIYNNEFYKDYPGIAVHSLNFGSGFVSRTNRDISKLKYLMSLPRLNQIIRSCKPDIVHAHYATSYGLLGALSGFHPYILSVWGSDIYIFPRRSIFHKQLVTFNLSKADRILATSYALSKETYKYTNKIIDIIPFGIDLNYFKPAMSDGLFAQKDVVIGVVKSLKKIYGIEYLIKAFAILKSRHKSLPLKLLIVGGGSYEQHLKKMVESLNIANDTLFTGTVTYDDIPKYQNMLSVSVTVSLSESFGVTVLEASACAKPVVVSNVGGLPEVVEDEVTGFIVEPENPKQTADAIEKIVLNKELQDRMGKAGRRRVRRLYNWDDNVKQMVKFYNDTLKGFR